MKLIELVPRDLEELSQEASALLKEYPQLDGVNIPDVLRLPIRSHHAAKMLLEKGVFAIPHIRSIDREVEDLMVDIRALVDAGLKSLLIVTGDAPTNLNRPTYPVTPIHVVQDVKKEFPDLKVYCALDPYRTSFKDELRYCQNKIRAGADGFFTQPFFDPELARIYLEQLDGVEVFVGLSPVTSEQSLNYWKTKNNAIFPASFELSLAHNGEVGKRIIDVVDGFSQNLYMMPIRIPASSYLRSILK